MPAGHPCEADVEQIVRNVFGEAVTSITRFPTGRCHYVFDVFTSAGRNVVVRIADPQSRHYIQGGIYWSKLLRPKGVPLPQLLAADADASFPHMVLERLQGTDLGNVYPQLSLPQKRAIAARVNEIQQIVATLPQAGGFGYATSYDQVLHQKWWDVIDDLVARSEKWVNAARVVDPIVIDRLREFGHSLQSYFAQVRPMPFLDDLTTRNVIIHDGQISGVVDIDEVCFGDPLFTPTLIRMSLLSCDFDTQYVDCLCPMERLTPPERRAFTFYTALACVVFLSELGQQFNCAQTPQVTQSEIAKLQSILDGLFDEMH